MSIPSLDQLEALPFPPYLIIFASMFGALCLMLVLRWFFIKRIKLLLNLSPSDHSTLLIAALYWPSILLIISIELFLLKSLLLHFDYLTASITQVLVLLMIFSFVLACILFINHFFTELMSRYARKSVTLKNSEMIVKGLMRIIILGLGALVLLGTLGISITPIIASLGITSLAVALALQPTLMNFFSGIQLVVDKPIRVDDYIELASGEQGFVQKIGWRSTWIKMLPNNTVVIPNSNLCNEKIINYFYPEKELSVPVEVSVHYDSNLDHVEQVTLEVAREILVSHEYGVDDYNTFVLFHTFDSSSINLTVMLRTKEYFNRFFIKSAFIKALHKRYQQEGIVIPYPIRAINTAQEST